MKKIAIIAQFTQLPGEIGNNRSRFKLISEMLSEKGYDVTVITSKFRELDRTQRSDLSLDDSDYKIVLLNEIGYKKNIGIKRILSMFSFALNLKKYLKTNNDRFDVIYACVPGLDSAYFAGKFAKKYKIPFIIDVQDVWPEAMYKLIVDIPVISDILFFPFRVTANKVYSYANGIVAVSETYLKIAKNRNKISEINECVFIGADLSKFDNIESNRIKLIKDDSEIWITYIGSIGHSYDIKTFIDASMLISKKGYSIKPIIIGSGPLQEEYMEYAKEVGSNALFTGWINHDELVQYLNETDAVINAIKTKAPQSITNKIGDYLASGKPILNGSLNKEFLDMVENYEIGINYSPEDEESLQNAILKFINMSTEEKIRIGDNSKNLARTKFDRRYTYIKIIEVVRHFLND